MLVSIAGYSYCFWLSCPKYYNCSSLLENVCSGVSELMQVLPEPVQNKAAEGGFGLCTVSQIQVRYPGCSL